MGEKAVTVSIKGSKQSDPWIVFNGDVDECKQNIAQAYGLFENIDSLTLHEVTVNAANVMQGVIHVTQALGGTVVPSEDAKGDTGWKPATDASKGAVAASEPAKEEKPEADALKENHLALIAAAKSVRELQEWWASNKTAFQDPEIQAAWKARGQALKAAA